MAKMKKINHYCPCCGMTFMIQENEPGESKDCPYCFRRLLVGKCPENFSHVCFCDEASAKDLLSRLSR